MDDGSDLQQQQQQEQQQLRFTRDYPTLQKIVNWSAEDESRGPLSHSAEELLSRLEKQNGGLTSVASLLWAVDQLLHLAYSQSNMIRVSDLNLLRVQLECLPGHCAAALGRPVPPHEISFDVSRFLSEDQREANEGSDVSFSGEEGEEECLICFELYRKIEMRSLMQCGKHHYCKDCLAGQVGTLAADVSTVNKLICPAPDCGALAAEFEVQALIPREKYLNYLDLLALASLQPNYQDGEENAGVWWCPNRECGAPIAKEEDKNGKSDEGRKIICPACQEPFCGDCAKKWHSNLKCSEAAEKQSDTFQGWLKKKGDKVKPCPKCRFGIEKDSGCNHMTCQQCGFQWCWLCCKAYLDDELYPNGHYGLGSPCNELRMVDGDNLDEAYEKANKTTSGVEAETRQFQNEWAAGAAERRRQAEYYRRLQRRQRVRQVPQLVVRGVGIAGSAIVNLPSRLFSSIRED